MESGVPGLTVGERLREDAVGVWYRAVREGEPVTLRILREDLEGREDARLLLVEEIRRIARIDHPALLRVHVARPGASRPWMVTEPIDGPSLEGWVAREGPLAPQAALRLVATLAEGFGQLEERRQVHVAPVPARLVRVDAAWRLLTFRDVRAWDELRLQKGRRYPAPLFEPPERTRASADDLAPLPFQAWVLGALLRFAVGAGPPRGKDGVLAPLPPGVGADVATAVTRLTDPAPGRRPQGLAAIQALLAGDARPVASPSSPARATIQAPIPRRRKRAR